MENPLQLADNGGFRVMESRCVQSPAEPRQSNLLVVSPVVLACIRLTKLEEKPGHFV